jgi:hypothetical protein
MQFPNIQTLSYNLPFIRLGCYADPYNTPVIHLFWSVTTIALPCPALPPPDPPRHRFREGLGCLDPAQDDLENGGDGNGKEHPGNAPDEAPEHQEEEEDGDRVQVHALPYQFRFYHVPDRKLYIRKTTS